MKYNFAATTIIRVSKQKTRSEVFLTQIHTIITLNIYKAVNV